MNGILPPLKPIAIKERNSIVFLKYGELDVIDGVFVLVDVKQRPRLTPPNTGQIRPDFRTSNSYFQSR